MGDDPKQYLAAHIREALAQDPRVNDLNIQVNVAGRKLFLTGNVPTEERCKTIAAVVRELVPDYEVHNEVTVQSLEPAGDMEKLS
ncbi:MAG TPA: BON domain-containing protein [Actinomycetota bacterium]|nr:BON domain-containing protein [Actinomycetota bacterium]